MDFIRSKTAMFSSLDPPLRPRRGVTLHVLGICRISTVHQDLHSLDDQEALLRRYIADHYFYCIGPLLRHKPFDCMCL